LISADIPSPKQDRPLDNLNLAFDIAEKHLNIPRMLDAEGKLHLSLMHRSEAALESDGGAEVAVEVTKFDEEVIEKKCRLSSRSVT